MAHREEDIVQVLTDHFDGLTAEIQRERRIWLTCPRSSFIELLAFIHDELDFSQLCTVTGMDTGEEFQLIYHLAHDGGIVINARVNAPHDDPTFETATDIFKGGVLYELEARNLLGLKIQGIPDDIRYPLPDNWPEGQYPQRKDWVNPADADTAPEGAADKDDATEKGSAKDGEKGDTKTDAKADSSGRDREAAKARAAAKRAAHAKNKDDVPKEDD